MNMTIIWLKYISIVLRHIYIYIWAWKNTLKKLFILTYFEGLWELEGSIVNIIKKFQGLFFF